jgi:hypothetical protein
MDSRVARAMRSSPGGFRYRVTTDRAFDVSHCDPKFLKSCLSLNRTAHALGGYNARLAMLLRGQGVRLSPHGFGFLDVVAFPPGAVPPWGH